MLPVFEPEYHVQLKHKSTVLTEKSVEISGH